MRTAQEVVDLLGGTYATARILGIKPPSVSGWLSAGRIPDDKKIRLAVVLEQRGLASRKEFFPEDWRDIWPELGCKCVST